MENDFKMAGVYALRHYVSLAYYGRTPELLAARNGMAAVCVCSGFIMEACGDWFLVTAGHVLDGIEESRKAGVSIDTFRLWDGWSLESPHKNHIPFDFDGAPKYRLHEDGLDYGLIYLRTLYVANLKANGIEPISEEQFGKEWPKSFDGYAMIGTPETTVHLERYGERATLLKQSVFVVPLEVERNPPPELVETHPRFYAKITIPEDSPEWKAIDGNIVGMSGGPVIAFRRDEKGLRYWVTAIQSGWLKSKRVIAASPFQAFARWITESLDEPAQSEE